MTTRLVLGFTGTRAGMNDLQLGQLSRVIDIATAAARGACEFHHGGAAGADQEAATFARAGGLQVHCHPCPGVVRRSPDRTEDVWHEVFPPLKRNRNIVAECHLLIAAPRTDKEELRSGTWATVRYARAAGKPVVMLSRGAK